MINSTVIITYPHHFFTTRLCVERLVRHNNITGPFVIVYDDCFNTEYKDYLTDLKSYFGTYFGDYSISYRPFSALGLYHNIPGWLRQQLAKLYLDKLVAGEKWLVIDSDCLLDKPLPLNKVLATYSDRADELDQKFQNYCNFMLAAHKQVSTNDVRYLTLESCPVRVVTKTLLSNLRQTVELEHTKDFFDLHVELINKGQLNAMDSSLAMSEWNLIESFRKNVMHDDVEFETSVHINNALHPESIPATCQFTTFYDSEDALGQAWFESQGIAVDESIWSKIYNLPK